MSSAASFSLEHNALDARGWLLSRLGGFIHPDAYTISKRENGSLMAVAAYEEFDARNCMVLIALEDGCRLHRREIAEVMLLPFERWGVSRITAKMCSTNYKSRSFARKIGFTLEAVLQDATQHGDLMFWRLWRDDARRLADNFMRSVNGKLETTARP